MERRWHGLCATILRLWHWLRTWWRRWRPVVRRWRRRLIVANRPGAHPQPIQPKPRWVQQEVLHLKALMPQAGCRRIAHHFNRRWAARRQMTVSKTYVADTCRKEHYRILHLRRTLKHRVVRPIPRNRVWGCDLLTKTDQQGHQHLAIAIIDHASRACLRLQRITDKSSWTLWQELAQAVTRYGRPQFMRTDNEGVFVSRLFRVGLWLLGIRQQRIEPGCPWQNGRVERFIGTVKRELKLEVLTSGQELDRRLTGLRQWYNHERPHDHLHGRTPAEVWAGVDVFTGQSTAGVGLCSTDGRQDTG